MSPELGFGGHDMKRIGIYTVLTVTALIVYDQTAQSDEPVSPSARTVSGGPTVVYLKLSSNVILENSDWVAILETPPLSFNEPVTIIADGKVAQQGAPSGTNLFTQIMREDVQAGTDVMLDASREDDLFGGVHSTTTVGHASTLDPGEYIYRLRVRSNDPQTVIHAGPTRSSWFRLQIFGCDSPAGCIPGDFNLDGRVDLVDFATFAQHFQG